MRGEAASLPPRLSSLRPSLGRKAKQEPTYRFYTLYDKVCWAETMGAAWAQVRRNGGAAGVDGVTIEQVEQGEGGVQAFLGALRADLLARRYRPGPVRRVYIPKANGKVRPLGIPTVRDRVAQTAVLLIVEPIFEADFLDCSLEDGLDVPLGHLFADLPVDHVAAEAVQNAAEVVEGPADIDVGDVHMPVFVGLGGLLEATAFLEGAAA